MVNSKTDCSSLSEQDIYNLHRRFKSLEARGMSAWSGLDHFLQWSKESGYFKRAYLRRYNPNVQYGPGNAFWSSTPDTSNKHYEIQEKTIPTFCIGCEESNPDTCEGCKGWEKWYVENWDKNIHRDIPEEMLAPRGRECFAYEHPDMVREGITFG